MSSSYPDGLEAWARIDVWLAMWQETTWRNGVIVAVLPRTSRALDVTLGSDGFRAPWRGYSCRP